MGISKYWRLCDDFTVIEAALLIVDEDPSNFPEQMEIVSEQDRPNNFTPVFSALKRAILNGVLYATIFREKITSDEFLSGDYKYHEWERDDKDGLIAKIEPSWHRTTIVLFDLKEWLRSRGFTSCFFFSNETNLPGYKDPSHPNYAPKLAAAVEAWETVNSDPELMRNLTPKQAIVVWLRKNADRFNLTKQDGNPNEQGIEEVAKVANWKPGGPAITPE